MRFAAPTELGPRLGHGLTLTHSARARRLEKNTNALQKEAKAFLDAIRSVSASSARIANTIDLFFGSDAGEPAMAANAYKRAVEEMEGSVARGIVRDVRAGRNEKRGKLTPALARRMRRTVRR